MRIALITAILISMVSSVHADSIFDARGAGRDVVPVAGSTRAMGGATVAGSSPLDCSVTNPFPSALADQVTITVGFAHTVTRTDDLGKEKSGISTLFPTITAVIPYGRVGFMTGLYLEKEGRLEFALADSAYGDLYDFTYRREASVHSVPLYVSARLHPQVMACAGLLFSAFDIRETHKIDFASSDRTDSEDAIDISASGNTFAGGLLVDLGFIRAAGMYRGKTDLDGALERESRYGDVWDTQDVSTSSESSFRLGARIYPHPSFAFEIDYEKTPWSGIEIEGEPVADHGVYRWSFGIEYRGRKLWDAAKHPLLAGYYRQPLGWDSELTGQIVEQVFSAGTSISLAGDRAAVALALEIGRRKAEERSDLSETFYGVSISVSALEAWHREVGTGP